MLPYTVYVIFEVNSGYSQRTQYLKLESSEDTKKRMIYLGWQGCGILSYGRASDDASMVLQSIMLCSGLHFLTN
jgi:hypothetical protein